jgi:uncharacterized protein
MKGIAGNVEKWGRKTAELSVNNRLLTIVMCILLTLIAGYGASSLKFSGDYQIFFSDENPELLTFLDLEGAYGKTDNISFVVIPKKGTIYQLEVIDAIHDITTQAWNLPFVSRVDSITNFQYTYAEGDNLIVENLVFDPSELREPGALERLQKIAINEPLLHKFITAPNGDATVINAVVQVDRKIAEDVIAAANYARNIKATMLEKYPNIEIQLTGSSMLSSAFSEVAIHDSEILIPSMYLLITIVMLAVLRSFTATITGLILVILSTIFGMGVGGWLGIELTPISITAPTIILTIAIADSVHIIAALRQRMRNAMERREAIIEAISSNAFPVTITSITTIIGFLSLNFSDSPPFHHLGNMTAAGIFMAWILSLTLLPAMLSVLHVKYKSAKEEEERGSRMKVVGDFILQRRYVALGLTTFSAIAAIAMIPRLEFNDVWSKYFAENIDIRRAIDATQPYFGTDNVEFIIDSGAPGNVLEPIFLQDVKGFSQWLRKRSEVVHVYSVSDIMRRLNKNLNQDKAEFFDIPDTRKKASQYLLVYELSLPYGMDLNDRIDIDRGKTRVTASIKDISTAEARQFIIDAKNWMKENSKFGATANATGNNMIFNYIADRNIQAMLEGSLFLVGSIFIIMVISFGSLGVGLLSVILNAIPILATFGIWAVLFGQVGFSIAIVGAVAVGLVIDFTVHITSKYIIARRHRGETFEDSIRYAFDTAGTAIVATTVILAAGFGLLSTSAFKINADMGLMTAIAIVLAMLINFLVMPALLSFNNLSRPEN